MSPVLNVLLCGICGSLLVSSWFLASLIVTVRDYYAEKTRQLRLMQLFKQDHINPPGD